MSIRTYPSVFPFPILDESLNIYPKGFVINSYSLGTLTKLYWLAKSFTYNVNIAYSFIRGGLTDVGTSSTGGDKTQLIETGFTFARATGALPAERTIPIGNPSDGYYYNWGQLPISLPWASLYAPVSGQGWGQYTVAGVINDGVDPPEYYSYNVGSGSDFGGGLYYTWFQTQTPYGLPISYAPRYITKSGSTYLTRIDEFSPGDGIVVSTGIFSANLTLYGSGLAFPSYATGATLVLKVTGCADVSFPLYLNYDGNSPADSFTITGTVTLNFNTYWPD